MDDALCVFDVALQVWCRCFAGLKRSASRCNAAAALVKVAHVRMPAQGPTTAQAGHVTVPTSLSLLGLAALTSASGQLVGAALLQHSGAEEHKLGLLRGDAGRDLAIDLDLNGATCLLNEHAGSCARQLAVAGLQAAPLSGQHPS